VIITIGVPEAPLQVGEQLEDLRLDRDVERVVRLVGDHSRGAHHERHRDHDALPHPARELVRVLLGAALRVRDADRGQHLDGARPGGLARGALVHPHHLGDLVADGEDRVERRHRLLEDHRDRLPRIARSSFSGRVSRSRPSNSTWLPASMRRAGG
jgi:hypothetical protein